MKFYVLDNGKEILDKSLMIAENSIATIDNKNPGTEWIDIPIHTFLIDHPDGYILFDTAGDYNWKEHWPELISSRSPYIFTEDQYLPNSLKKLHVSPEDIKYVIISHLHADHAGCLSMFKNATVYVNNTELVTTLRQYVLGEDLNVHVPTDIKAWLDAKLHWRPVTDDEREIELVHGVKILNFGSGHSWGMLGMHVSLPSGKNFLAVADAIYLEGNIHPSLNFPSIVYDTIGYTRTVKFIQDYAAKTGAQILYGHDIKQFQSLIHSTEGFYD